MIKTVFTLLALLVSSQAADIDLTWIIQTYEDVTVQPGDTITFNWPGVHNVYIHPTMSCDETGAITVGTSSPASYTFTTADAGGSFYFACDISNHCEAGQHITVNVEGQSFFCPICGEGNAVTTPDGIVTVPGQEDRTCAQLEEAASVGNIGPTQCPLLQQFVTAPCGCAPITDGTTPAPVDAPTEAPVEVSQPTDAPVDVSEPTDAPVEMVPGEPTTAPDPEDAASNDFKILGLFVSIIMGLMYF